MSSLLLLTNALQPSTEVLPALGLLLHNVRVAPAEGPALVDTPGADVILIDGRRDLPQVRSLCQLLRSTGPGCPLVLVVTEGGLAAVTADWGIDDVLLDTAGPRRSRRGCGSRWAASRSSTTTPRWRSATATSPWTRRRTPRS